MSDISTSSVPLGRWRRMHIRVHALFFLGAIFALFLATSHPVQGGAAYAAMAIGLLFASVLAHEGGHALAAAHVGGNADPIVVGPLGGLGTLETPREPHAELIAVLAGPLVNLGIVLAALPPLLVAGVSVPGLLHPLDPADLLVGTAWLVALKLTFWINWVLLVANLLPAFPMDGARMLRAFLWPALDYRAATLLAVRASKLTAVALCIWAWLASDPQSAAPLPAWVPLLVLAVWTYFSAVREAARTEESDWDEEMLNYDFSQGYTSLERSLEQPRRSGSPLERWLKRRRELRRHRRQSQEQQEERQVDAILMRLHETGMSGLTAKEQALLQRVSARYRNRQSN